MKNKEILLDLFQKHNISLTNEQAEQFLQYYEILIETNKFLNLTAITDFSEVVVKHFIDSVFNYKYFKQNASICDIGTGAGFPAIPLKIMRPDLNFTLVDSLNKRINFLNNVISLLKLTNITTIHSRAQELPEHNVSRETFAYTTARAVAPLNILIEYCIPYTKTNGEFIALKSQNSENEIKQAQNALKILNSSIILIEKHNLTLNNENLERNLIYIKKNKKTETKYPRLKNIIKTKPL